MAIALLLCIDRSDADAHLRGDGAKQNRRVAGKRGLRRRLGLAALRGVLGIPSHSFDPLQHVRHVPLYPGLCDPICHDMGRVI